MGVGATAVGWPGIYEISQDRHQNPNTASQNAWRTSEKRGGLRPERLSIGEPVALACNELDYWREDAF